MSDWDSLISGAIETQRRKGHPICHLWLWHSQLTWDTDISSGGWSPNTRLGSGSSELLVTDTWKEQKAKEIPILPQAASKTKGTK